MLITGSDKAFAAGADIKEMADKSYIDVFSGDYAADYDRLARVRKPMVAAVAGFALGGGCELAMLCDIIIAADNAKFGQPEIKLGVIPGIGGTQRLTRAVGKAKAMDLILTGRMMDAAEAERSGLVARVVPVAEPDGRGDEGRRNHRLDVAAVGAGGEGGGQSRFETTLAEGVRFERRVFHALFATEDQKEGMTAFVEKRPAKFRKNDWCRAASYLRTQITRTSEALAASTPVGSSPRSRVSAPRGRRGWWAPARTSPAAAHFPRRHWRPRRS